MFSRAHSHRRLVSGCLVHHQEDPGLLVLKEITLNSAVEARRLRSDLHLRSRWKPDMLSADGTVHDRFLSQLENSAIQPCSDQHVAEVADRRVVEPLAQPQQQPLGRDWIRLPEGLTSAFETPCLADVIRVCWVCWVWGCWLSDCLTWWDGCAVGVLDWFLLVLELASKYPCQVVWVCGRWCSLVFFC